jgi:hypothetical protein
VAARGTGEPDNQLLLLAASSGVNPKSESSSGTDNPTNRLLSWRLSRHYRLREDLVADWLGEGLLSTAKFYCLRSQLHRSARQTIAS